MPARKDFRPGEFCWIDLAAHDLEAAIEWYSAVFDWSHVYVESEGPPYAFLMRGDAAIGGAAQMMDEMKAQGIPPVWNSYVSSEDCKALEAKVRELGGTVTVPTMEVPGFGKLAFFLDPEGASFAAWQSTSMDGPGFLVNEPGSLSWNELMTRDVAAAREFYGALIGWTFEAMPMGEIEYTMARAGDADACGLFPMTGPQFDGVPASAMPANWLVYFCVADCEATTAKVSELGGQVSVPPTEIPIGTFSVLQDPQGGTFATIQLNPSAC